MGHKIDPAKEDALENQCSLKQTIKLFDTIIHSNYLNIQFLFLRNVRKRQMMEGIIKRTVHKKTLRLQRRAFFIFISLCRLCILAMTMLVFFA